MKQIWNTSGQSLNDKVLHYTAGDDARLDEALFLPYDLQGTRAHVCMLQRQGLLTEDELNQVETGLDQLQQQFNAGEFRIPSGMEDCHTAIEAYITEHFGEVGKKIHTARSRNDQVLTMMRLYQKEQLQQLMKLSRELVQQWQSWSAQYQETAMPGYTHMQKAMPTTVGRWQGAYADLLEDLIPQLETALQTADQSPLGSGAGFGIPLEIDRQSTADDLGFSRVQENPLSCQLSRGLFESQSVFAMLQIMTVLARWANDLLLFTMDEFQYFSLPAEYCTSSSIMPQKKNYDVLEILRGTAATVEGAWLEVHRLTSTLHSGYQRDLQLLKSPLVRAFQKTVASLEIATLISTALIVHEDRLQAAMSHELYATDRVYELVKAGMSFREAYAKVKQDVASRRPS